MNRSLEITTLDIALFFFNRSIGVKRRTEIIKDLWTNRLKLLEYHMYSDIKEFTIEIENIILDLSLDKVIFKESDDILIFQEDLGFNFSGYERYKLNRNKTEDFLKQCKLRLMYEIEKGFIRMKMSTLMNKCGFLRRDKRLIEELGKCLLELGLYLTDGYNEVEFNTAYLYNSRNIKDIRMDDYLKIYSY